MLRSTRLAFSAQHWSMPVQCGRGPYIQTRTSPLLDVVEALLAASNLQDRQPDWLALHSWILEEWGAGIQNMHTWTQGIYSTILHLLPSNLNRTRALL